MKTFLYVLLSLLTIQALGQDKSYIIVFLNKKTNAVALAKDESQKIMEGHLANIKRLALEGKLLAAGPFEGGGGIFVMNSTNTEEVKEWISTDPGIKAERWNLEIMPYQPRHGSVCPVGETYEMINYTFIRYDAIVSKFTAADYPQILEKHNQYLKEIINAGNVITEAIFSERDGGVLILRGDIDTQVVEADPAIQAGLIQHEIKKLYIAKGSFCER